MVTVTTAASPARMTPLGGATALEGAVGDPATAGLVVVPGGAAVAGATGLVVAGSVVAGSVAST
jgi:hypothetical protein